jgi:hypothetical protein
MMMSIGGARKPHKNMPTGKEEEGGGRVPNSRKRGCALRHHTHIWSPFPKNGEKTSRKLERCAQG